MAIVLFYEKPGCINNTLQKQQLTASGHKVVDRNLITENWNAEELRLYFGNKPVDQWFNNSAPAIKRGVINPEQLDEYQAISLMLEDPLLIRRPLMHVAGKRVSGFDQEQVNKWIGLTKINAKTDYQQCHKASNQQSCRYE